MFRIGWGVFVAALLIGCADAYGWGPGTHVQLGTELLNQLWLLPAGMAALLLQQRRAFLYGNVAADVVLAKKMTRVKQLCHHWQTGFSILEQAGSDEQQAFALGYLSHLAADTVAHNKFLPRQMALSGSTINFGHLYWELRADAQVPVPCWNALRTTIRTDHPGARALLVHHLRDTLLSFRANERVFYRMNLLVSMNSWRRSIAVWGRVSRWPLPESVVAAYGGESLERMVDVLSQGRRSTVLHDDPNGNAALGYALAQRRQLKQMKRARMSLGHVVSEAAAIHAVRSSDKTAKRLLNPDETSAAVAGEN